LVGWFQRLMHAGTDAAGLFGVAVAPVVEVVVGSAVVPGVAPLVVVATVVATVVPFDTVALLFLPSLPKISNAARKPTAIASTATSHVFKPLRSIAAAR
jgi:hypothetical protein